MCLCTVSGKAHRTTGTCSGLSKHRQAQTHPHRASVCTWTQTEPVQNPPPLPTLRHCCPETCQTGHGTGMTRGYQDGGKKTGGVREGMKVTTARTQEDWGGTAKIKVDSFKKSQEDKDYGMLEVCMLRAYSWCRCRF